MVTLLKLLKRRARSAAIPEQRPSLLLGLAAFVVAAAVFPVVVAAEKPTVQSFSGPNSVELDNVCSFPITIKSENAGTVTLFTQSGALKRIHVHSREQDTFEANGKSLIG